MGRETATDAGAAMAVDTRTAAARGQPPERRRRLAARLTRPSIWAGIGPGVVTGAADDDPSGIATYSQTGAAYGYQTLWTLWLTFPLMFAIQYVCALIGRATGKGLAANIRGNYPTPVLGAIVVLLFVANVINLAADIGAMGQAVKLLIGGPAIAWAVAIAALALVLLIRLSFHAYARLLKYLTLSLFAYAGTLFFVQLPWREIVGATFWPRISWNAGYLTAIVAIFGTTISPYLFFWQASHEVESQQEAPGEQPLLRAPRQGKEQLRRAKWDTVIGMAVSNLIAFCIMLTAAAELHRHGITKIESATQAAQALRPVAGNAAFFLFALGIIGTGMLAVPTLAGSAAFAIAETFRWPKGLDKRLYQASGFYGIVILGTVLGVALNFTPINPIDALYWSAVLNGVIAGPLMVMIMLLVGSQRVMGKFAASPLLRFGGWAATVAMLALAVAMLATMKR
jgi:NRAMP (natural resistance-associated macrophage protein)-like metal ion transporter